MRIDITRLGNITTNKGLYTTITSFDESRPYTIVLSVDDEEVQRKTIEPGETYSIALAMGRFFIAVRKREMAFEQQPYRVFYFLPSDETPR